MQEYFQNPDKSFIDNIVGLFGNKPIITNPNTYSPGKLSIDNGIIS